MALPWRRFVRQRTLGETMARRGLLARLAIVAAVATAVVLPFVIVPVSDLPGILLGAVLIVAFVMVILIAASPGGPRRL